MNLKQADGPVALPEDERVFTPEDYIGRPVENGSHRVESINAVGSRFVVFNLRNLKTGEVDQVMKVLKEEFDPRTPLLRALPQALEQLNQDPDRVIRICERLLKLDPNMEAGAFEKGVAHLVKGEAVQALSAFDLAASINPADIWNQVHRAACCAVLQRDKECLRDLLAAAEINGADLKKCLQEAPNCAAEVRDSLKREASEAATQALRDYL